MVMTFLAAAMAEDMRRNKRDKAALQQELATDMEGERVEATEPRKIAYPTPKPVSAPRRRSTVAEVVVPTMAKATSLVDAVSTVGIVSVVGIVSIARATSLVDAVMDGVEPHPYPYPYPYPSSAYPWQVMDGVEAVVEGEPAFDATTHRRRRP